MQVGFVGAAASGKTTIFELLSNTQGAFLSPDKANVATVDVPDSRIGRLSELYQPQKKTFAKISFTDINRLAPGDRENNNKSLNHLKLMDALVLVINGFSPGRTAQAPQADLEFCLSELIMSDLEQVERKLGKLRKLRTTPTLAGKPELEVLQKLGETLESNTLLSAREFPAEVWKELGSYNFLTRKPMFVVINLSEEQGLAGPAGLQDFVTASEARGFPAVRIYAKLEKDLQELSAEDRAVFTQEYDLPLSGKESFIRQAYTTSGLISFLTVGPDEVRAWTVKRGSPIREAAGVIHKDFTNNFVRAEIISFEKLLECGSEQEAHKRGWLRSEKKEYPVQDGDVVHILANK